ncbi:MAG: hypothetical protein GY870_04700 [archaeon]|nr:hypothetical protein [archaeon]
MNKPVGVFIRNGKDIDMKKCFGGRLSSCRAFWNIDFDGKPPWTQISINNFVGFGEIDYLKNEEKE